MTEIQAKQLRAALIALLDDEDGIPIQGYEDLRTYVEMVDPDAAADIFDIVETFDFRAYLPEAHGLIA